MTIIIHNQNNDNTNDSDDHNDRRAAQVGPAEGPGERSAKVGEEGEGLLRGVGTLRYSLEGLLRGVGTLRYYFGHVQGFVHR